VTGATGCIGHCVVEALVRDTTHELVLLVRDSKRIHFARPRPGITILHGDVRQVSTFANMLSKIDAAVLLATSWGPEDDAQAVNVGATLELVRLLDPAVCKQVIHFSTASILGPNLDILPQADSLGTPYIRSKAAAHRALLAERAVPVTILAPSLVVGGAEGGPVSHVTKLLRQIATHDVLLRVARADGSFHFIHAADVGTIVRHLLDNPGTAAKQRTMVLGGPPVSVNETLSALARHLDLVRIGVLPVDSLAELFISMFKIQLTPWDRYCLRERHFTYEQVVRPETFGLTSAYPTLDAALAALKIERESQ
jgi:nucleoside-diphosphate-sugar epimerase